MYTHLMLAVRQQVAADHRRVLLATADRHRLVRCSFRRSGVRDSHRADGVAGPIPTRIADPGSSLLPVGSSEPAVRGGTPVPAERIAA